MANAKAKKDAVKKNGVMIAGTLFESCEALVETRPKYAGETDEEFSERIENWADPLLADLFAQIDKLLKSPPLNSSTSTTNYLMDAVSLPPHEAAIVIEYRMLNQCLDVVLRVKNTFKCWRFGPEYASQCRRWAHDAGDPIGTVNPFVSMVIAVRALEGGVLPPAPVANWLMGAMQGFINDKGATSMNECMGLKASGRGKDNAVEKSLRATQHGKYAGLMYFLVSRGASVACAAALLAAWHSLQAEVAPKFYEYGPRPLDADTLITYWNRKWKKLFPREQAESEGEKKLVEYDKNANILSDESRGWPKTELQLARDSGLRI